MHTAGAQPHTCGALKGRLSRTLLHSSKPWPLRRDTACTGVPVCLQGLIKTYTSAGVVGYKGSRKSQPVAAEKAAEELARRALKLGYSSVQVRRRPGRGGCGVCW